MQNTILLTELSSVNIENINKEDLINVSGVSFDNSLPLEQRAARLIEKIKNPYCFRVGDIGVKLEFAENAPALQDVLVTFFRRKKSGL